MQLTVNTLLIIQLMIDNETWLYNTYR